jgi:hypothetical protein
VQYLYFGHVPDVLRHAFVRFMTVPSHGAFQHSIPRHKVSEGRGFWQFKRRIGMPDPPHCFAAAFKLVGFTRWQMLDQPHRVQLLFGGCARYDWVIVMLKYKFLTAWQHKASAGAVRSFSITILPCE